MTIRQVGSEFAMRRDGRMDRWTGRHDEARVAFRNFVYAPKKIQGSRFKNVDLFHLANNWRKCQFQVKLRVFLENEVNSLSLCN